MANRTARTQPHGREGCRSQACGPAALVSGVFVLLATATALCDPPTPSPFGTVAARLILPAGTSPTDVGVTVLGTDRDSTRDLSAGPATIEADGTLNAPYADPGTGSDVLIRLVYPEGPDRLPRTWLTFPEAGRAELRLPSGPAAGAEATLPLLPSTHGFRFVNHFEASPLPALERGLGIQLNAFGLCGGMSFAAADLFLAGHPRPETSTPPPANSPLYDYIYRRQSESLGGLAVEGLRFARWMTLPEDTLGGTNKRTWDEIAVARDAIDAGRPAVLGLVYIGEKDREPVWNNHQVLTFAYQSDESGATVFRIYDSNFPGRDDVTIRATPTVAATIDDPVHPGTRIEVPGVTCRQFIGRRDLRPVRGFFVMPYFPATPPNDLSPIARGTSPHQE